MRKLSYIASLLSLLFLSACGDGGGFVPEEGTGGGVTPGGDIVVSAVDILTSSPTLPSDAAQELDVTIVVRDESNVAVGGVTVLLSADSGILTVSDPVTNNNGIITAAINAGGDPTNRTITITADANGVVGTTSFEVVGTQLTVTGPSSLPQGDSAPYTVVLEDAAGIGISGETVDVSSSNGNTLAAATLTTDTSGQAQVQLTAAAAGPDTLTATAMGLTATTDLVVSDDSFSLTAPVAGTEVNLNTAVPVTLSWSVGGTPQANEPISFSATRGTLGAFSVTTNASGVASTTIQSNNAGASVITASNSAGTTTSVAIEFVADTPNEIAVQASPFTIGPGEQSAITAIVRDAANNLVKNVVVQFVLDDVTGGQLSVAQAVTNSQGRAQTFYTASSTTSANNGVTVTASVQSNPAINQSVQLTVAQREVFISIGTGNDIFEPNSAQYRKEFIIQVTDSQGNGVSGVTVQAGILSEFYSKGFWTFNVIAGLWVQTINDTCPDEDVNRNGVLDAGEDFNSSGRVEAGNIALVSAQGGGGGTFITDGSGSAIVDVLYPQDHARWVRVALEATTTVQGTEFAKASRFYLPINAEDVDDPAESPPGQSSPFGISAGCDNLN